MKNYFGKSRKARGFVGIVFLAIALIGIVIAAIAAMSRSSSSGTASSAAATKASVLIKQAADYKLAWDIFAVDVPAGQSYLANGYFGRYDMPGTTYVTVPLPPSGIFVASLPSYLGHWNMFGGVYLPGVGAPYGADIVANIGGLTKDVCQAINHQLYNDPLTADPAVSNAAASYWWTGGPAYIDDQAITASNYYGRFQGCVQSSDGYYVYYRTVEEK